jgi:protein-tyrosine-phosphatase
MHKTLHISCEKAGKRQKLCDSGKLSWMWTVREHVPYASHKADFIKKATFGDGLLKVLFVCSGNSHRSPLAEALLRKMRPNWTVDSAGVQVGAIPVAEEIKEFLREEGAEQYLKSSPESLRGKRLGDYDVIVAMEDRHRDYVLSLCPECESKIIVWDVRDPYFMDRGNAWKIYEQIKEKVKELAEGAVRT